MPAAARAAPRRTRCTGKGCRRLAKPGRKRCDDCKPGARPADNRPKSRKKLYGFTEPRLFTKPLRPLTRKTSKGYEVIDFAELIGEPLLPWEQFAAIHALELLPDGSFRFRTVLILVARQNGKSTLKRIITLWRMYMDGARSILGVAQDVSLAREQWKLCQATIHACPDLEAEWRGVRNVNGDEMFWAGTGRYAIKAANDKAGRGTSNDEVNIDELRTQKDWKAWGSLSKTTMARANSQLWAMSNAGDDTSVVLNQLRESALAGRDDSLCILEWSAPPGCELDDVTAWQQANPALGYTALSEAAIRSALSTDPPAIFRTEVLCQQVDQLEGAIDLAAWKDCGDPGGTMESLRDRIATVIDTAESGHTALVAAARLTDGRVRVEVVRAWETAAEAWAELPLLVRQVKPRAFGWFPRGPAAENGPALRALAISVNRHGGKRDPGEIPENGELSGQREAEACMGLAGLVTARRLIHPGVDDLLNAHAGAAQRTPAADGGWKFTRKAPRNGAPPLPCDAITAAGGAALIALTMPEPRAARIRILGA